MVSTDQLRHNRRYAILACGAVAALLPGDAITLLLETVPLYLLFELSVLLARISGRRDARRATAGEAGGGGRECRRDGAADNVWGPRRRELDRFMIRKRG